MRNILPKKIDWTIAGAVILGLGFFGMIWYTEARYENITAELEERNTEATLALAELDTKIKELAEIFESTLTEEQRRNRDLQNKLEDVTDSIGVLERISTTDRDLLKKYSKTYFLNENYSPLDLDPIPSEFRSPSAGNYQMLADVLPYLEDLFEDTEDEGLNLLAQSAYRSFGTQTELKAAYTVTYGSGANRFSADQGYSEHQLGTTLDFTTTALGGALSGFDKTPEYQWLLQNAYKYGFILSYPQGNEHYIFEPWHWRFVGKALARELHDEEMNFYDMEQREIDSYLPRIFD